MNRNKVIISIMTTLVAFLALYLIMNFFDSKVEFDIFKENRELFEEVKKETIRLASDHHYINEPFLFKYGGYFAENQFHDDVDENLQNKIKQVLLLSEDKLNFIRYEKYDNKHFVSFIFDWERAYGNAYHIVYCESYDTVKRFYDETRIEYGHEFKTEYELVKLDVGWYGIMIK